MSVGYCTTCLTACQKSHWGQWNIELIQSMAGGILERVQIVAAVHNSSPVGKTLSLGCGVIPLFTQKIKSRALVFSIYCLSLLIPRHCFQAIFLAFCFFLKATSHSLLVLAIVSLFSNCLSLYSVFSPFLPSWFWLLILAWLKATSRPRHSPENASRAASTQRRLSA